MNIEDILVGAAIGVLVSTDTGRRLIAAKANTDKKEQPAPEKKSETEKKSEEVKK